MTKKQTSNDLKVQIIELIYQVVDEMNEDGKYHLEKTPTTALMGSQQGLDSLGLVNFVVSVEQKIEEAFGRSVSAIANERALLQKSSPLKNIESLAEFILASLTSGESKC